MKDLNEKIIINTKEKEKEYWTQIFDSSYKKSIIPYSDPDNINEDLVYKSKEFLLDSIYEKLYEISGGNNSLLHVVIVSAVAVLIRRYSQENVINIGTIFQDIDKNKLINNLLPLQLSLNKNKMSMKDVILHTQNTISSSINYIDFPIERFFFSKIENNNSGYELFDLAVLLNGRDNIDELKKKELNMIFDFEIDDSFFKLKLHYNCKLYVDEHIECILQNLMLILKQLSENINCDILDIQLVKSVGRSTTNMDFLNIENDLSLLDLFAVQVGKGPDRIAVVYKDFYITFKEIDRHSNCFANELISNGVKRNTPVAIYLNHSVDLIIAKIGILKAGGIYVPIDYSNPNKRINSIIKDCSIEIIITDHTFNKYCELKSFKDQRFEIIKTESRSQIKNLDSLPFPDRSLIDQNKYSDNIGIAMCKNSVLLQATRGCPYKCAYCHKIWPKTHVYRSAENIFEEVKKNYDLGYKRFVFIDDIFNLNFKNSSRFFELILKNNMDVNFFFPAGVRGDIMSKDYIDLMVEAGTVNIALALETASPRMQKLIGKNLNLDKFNDVCEYFCKKYPQVLTDLFVMLGFPTETEKEAIATIDFVKQKKWFHFPLINILKIYPNTDIEKIAMQNGVSQIDILESQRKAYHELPTTLPFDSSFVYQLQNDFLYNYFLDKERMKSVLTNQMKVLCEDEIILKYNSYLPSKIDSLEDLYKLVGLKSSDFVAEKKPFENLGNNSPIVYKTPKKGNINGLKVMLIDLSQHFSSENEDFYYVSEIPLGLVSLLTYAKDILKDKIDGKIIKSGVDFDDYSALWNTINEFKPDIIGVRSLNFYQEFFHKTINFIRSWNISVPIIAGGPYATSDYKTILQDANIDLVILGEGEHTFVEVINEIIANNNQLPSGNILSNIKGVAFRKKHLLENVKDQKVIFVNNPVKLHSNNLDNCCKMSPDDIAYVMYTSGTTGTPKGSLIPYSGIIRLVNKPNYINFDNYNAVLQTGAIDFDASTFEIWGALINGLKLVMAPKEDILIAENLKSIMYRNDIDLMWLTSPFFNNLIDIDPEIFKKIKGLIVGGDVLSINHIRKLRNYRDNIKIVNGYGPTENTTFSTFYRIEKNHQVNIPIGVSISNSSAYIVSDQNKLMPSCGIGELYVGGKGISKGYLNNPDLTNEKFVKTEFDSNSLLYKTGDLAQLLPGGNILYLGRKDRQLKIRGFRIEPKEIECFILKDSNVSECVIKAFQTGNNQKEIFAFVVFSKKILNKQEEIIKLKNRIKSGLPIQMNPSRIVVLESVPFDSRGKINNSKLKEKAFSKKGDENISYNSEIEKELAAVWSQVLEKNKEDIDVNSNFFELGGHSLKVTTMASLIQNLFHVKISYSDFFVNPTIDYLANFIETSKKEKQINIKKAEKKEYYPLSAAQERIFVTQNYNPDSVSYNIPLIFPINNKIKTSQIEGHLDTLLKRHSILRTSFKSVNGIPFQFVNSNIKVPIKDIRCKHSDLQKSITEIIEPFSFEQAPLLRVYCIEDDLKAKYLFIDVHHIISDGTSHSIIIKDFLKLLEGELLNKVRLDYIDYSEWQNKWFKNSDSYLNQKKYWMSIFNDNLNFTNLNFDKELQEIRADEGQVIDFKLNKSHFEINRFNKDFGLTMFMYIFSVYSILQSKYYKTINITIGIPISGRSKYDLNDVVGMFVNMIVLRVYPNPEMTIKDYLNEVKKITLDSFENQDFQYEELIGCLNDLNKEQVQLFDSIFTMQNSFDLNDLRKKASNLQKNAVQDSLSFENNSTKYKLMLDAMEDGDNLRLWITFSKRFFRASTVDKMVCHFKEVSDYIIENINTKKIKDIKLSSTLNQVQADLLLEEDDGQFLF